MTADTLLSRLDHVRRAGPGRWRAQCPVHGGKNRQSLAVREMDDGTVLLKCFAHDCGAADIVGAVGLEMHDLFPERDLPHGEHSRKPERRPWTAADALAAMAYEATVIAILARDIAHGAPVTPDIKGRLLAAAGRLNEIAEVAHAS